MHERCVNLLSSSTPYVVIKKTTFIACGSFLDSLTHCRLRFCICVCQNNAYVILLVTPSKNSKLDAAFRSI
jgi:hypothetical protein